MVGANDRGKTTWNHLRCKNAIHEKLFLKTIRRHIEDYTADEGDADEIQPNLSAHADTPNVLAGQVKLEPQENRSAMVSLKQNYHI